MLVAGMSGCTVFESYTVTETRTQPARPVEVAREGDISAFNETLAAGADIATAIVAPVAAVAKAAIVSVVDLEVNRAKETRTLRAARWFTSDESAFPRMEGRMEGQFEGAELEARGDGTGADEPAGAAETEGDE
jgi:hypothetical protein